MSEAGARGLPDDLEERVLDILDGPSAVMEAGLRDLAAANPRHAEEILGWLRTGAATTPEPMPGDMFGELRIVDLLGRGGMGVVYRAHDDQLARDVAVKVLPGASAHEPGRVARFLREARIAAQLRHPHIVAIHRVGEEGGRPFMAMELVAGMSLERVLAGLRARVASVDALTGADWAQALVAGAGAAAVLPTLASSHAEVAARLAAAIAEALAHAHGQGVVHRDLKPGNIMVRVDGTPVLLDFGLARAATGTRLTAEGQVMGTPEYFAPEQLTHEGNEPDARTDVWAFGVMLYQMLTLALPFGAYGPQLVARIQTAEPLALRRRGVLVPRDLETICFTCLEKDPARRYPSAVELLADLRAFLAFRPVQARPVGRVGRAWRWARRNRLAATGAVVAGFAAIGTPSGIAVVQAAARHEVEQEKTAKDLANGELRATNAKLAAETLRKEGALQNARQRAAEASLQLAQRLLQRGQWQAALDAYGQAEANGHGDVFAIAMGRVEALEGSSHLDDAREILEEIDARELSPAQRARVDLVAGEKLVGRILDPNAGMDRIERALASGALSSADATYARGLLAPTLAEARRLFEDVLELDPGHRAAAIQLLPLVMFTGSSDDLGTLAGRLGALFPDDPLGPAAHAVLALVRRDHAALARACASMRRRGGDAGADVLIEFEDAVLRPGAPSMTSAAGIPTIVNVQGMGRLALRVVSSLQAAGAQLAVHPRLAEMVRACLPVLVAMVVGKFPSEPALVRIEAIWPDGLWDAIRAHDVERPPHERIASVRRARELGSAIGRLVGPAVWDSILLRVRMAIASDHRALAATDAALAAELAATLREMGDSRLTEPNAIAEMVGVARDLHASDLAVELALRRRSADAVGRLDGTFGLAVTLLDRGAYLWAHELLTGLGTESGHPAVRERLASCEAALRKLGVTLPIPVRR